MDVTSGPSKEAITRYLCSEVAALLEIELSAVDPEAPFDTYGFASSDAIFLSSGLSDFLGFEVSATLAWDHPNINSLANFLAKVCSGEAELPDDAPDWDLDSDLFA